MADSQPDPLAADDLRPTGSVRCPQCQATTPGQARYCHACGADLAVLALLAEREVLADASTEAPAPHVPEMLIRRLGSYLLRNGFITESQLERALARQQELSAQGQPARLGQVLIDSGALTRQELDRAITEQVLALQAALQESNRELERRVAKRTAELSRALTKLSELNQLKINFIANISHELRTPLAQIKGYSALLAEGSLGELADDQRHAIDTIVRAGERLHQLINDLISFASTARGDLHVNLQAVELQPLVDRVVATLAGRATLGQVAVHVGIEPGQPPVLADSEKLSWLLYQLIENAVKFTPPTGQVFITAEVENQHVVVSVRDTGIGIPADRLEEIFEPFHQLDSSSTRRYGGTGLGLAFVRRLSAAHNTTVEVESKVGAGSTFSIKLPCAQK